MDTMKPTTTASAQARPLARVGHNIPTDAGNALARITPSLRFAAQALLLGLLVLAPRCLQAHGLHGHVHVTGWAIENLPPGELKEMFADPDVFRAALSGAMFPDTGYATDEPGSRDYAEAAHWEPFIERFIERVRATHGPAYETKEEKMLVAFLLGCASHGLQDELFDSTFLHEAEERDGRGQEVTDPATDGFLILDGYFRHLPGSYFPVDEVVPLYANVNPVINSTLISYHINLVRNAYVNDSIGARAAMNNGRRYRRYIPWTSDNYLRMETPGSLAAEVEPTLRHMLALWERLHGRFDEANLVVHAWPEAPRRLRSSDHTRVASWITLVLGKGIEEGSATAELLDASGSAVPMRLRYTRWGGTSRLVRFQPTADLIPAASYQARIEPGARLVDGTLTLLRHQHDFQVECSDTPPCEPVTVTDDPVIALADPTATPTSTPSPSPPATASETPSATSTPSPTSSHSPSATVKPTASPTSTPTLVPATPTPSITPTHSPTETVTITATHTPSITPRHTATQTAPPADDNDNDSCAVDRRSRPRREGTTILLVCAGLILLSRRMHNRHRCQRDAEPQPIDNGAKRVVERQAGGILWQRTHLIRWNVWWINCCLMSKHGSWHL